MNDNNLDNTTHDSYDLMDISKTRRLPHPVLLLNAIDEPLLQNCNTRAAGAVHVPNKYSETTKDK